MSFINLIEKIQKKPRYIRVQITWLCVALSMVIVVSIWWFSFKTSLPVSSKSSQSLSASSETKQFIEEIKEGVPSLIETFKASIGAFLGEDISEELEGIKSQADLESQSLENQITVGTEAKEDSQLFELEQPKEDSREIKPAKLPLRE